MTSEAANTEKAGGTRFSSGKPGGWWYAPLYGLRLVAEVWQPGAAKYAPMDWRNGQSFSTLMDCAFRHMMAMNMNGPLSRDVDTIGPNGEVVKGTNAYHAACVVWNLLAMLTFIALGRLDLDDVTGWQTVTTAEKNEKGYSYENPPPSPSAPQAPGPGGIRTEVDNPYREMTRDRTDRIHRELPRGRGCGSGNCRVCYPERGATGPAGGQHAI